MRLTHLSLFSGIGGIDLAAEWAGFKTVGQCEWADYPTRVLEKHWPDAPRWRDIRTLTKESFIEKTGRTTVDLISGGFPCQPFSVAGKRGGDSDDRFLWPEMLRVISELQPRWVLGENVAGIVSMALDQVLSDLENIGYEVQAFIVPACAVDAQHRRDRCFILAHAISDGRRGRSDGNATRHDGPLQIEGSGRGEEQGVLANTKVAGLERRGNDRDDGPELTGSGKSCWTIQNNWLAEPDVGRVAHGVPNRVDRLKCLGNAVVPQQVYPILKAIAELEATHEQQH